MQNAHAKYAKISTMQKFPAIRYDCVLGTVIIFFNVLYVWFLLSDAVDRRGRKVKQSSSEDLRKYYDLDGNIFLLLI